MKRFYRDYHQNEGLIRFEVHEGESDLLFVVSPEDSEEVIKSKSQKALHDIREILLMHISERPEFRDSLKPLVYEGNNEVLTTMYRSGIMAQVGPMASVAGITSAYVGELLIKEYPDVELLIENGGDIYISGTSERHIGIYAGESPLSNKLTLRIRSEWLPLGICTSAGTIGHSLSFGKADAVVVLSKNTALADAVATSTGNKVKSASDIQEALNYAMGIEEILGCLIIVGDQVGAAGIIELC